MQAESVQPAESETVMTSSGQTQNEIDSERAIANTRIVEIESCCTYPNERREKNQIYTLLNISNSANEQEEKSYEYVNGTGWEEAVQGWNKTAPFAYLQLQKRARKTRTSESVSGCLYCLDMMQVIDKCLEQEPRTIDQLKSDFKLSTRAATDSISEKQQTLLYSDTALNTSSAIDDTKRESYYGKIYSTQTSQGEKKKMSLKEAQASLSERKLLLIKESQLSQAEKKTVPIKEYNILPPGKPQSLETVKCKDIKTQEPSVCNLVSSEATTAKSSLILPPLKDTTLKNSLDPSPKKSKTVISQASGKTFCAVSETDDCTRVFKTKEQKCEKGIGIVGDTVKEKIKIREITSFVPGLSKTSFISRNHRCYWRCAVLPDRKIATMSNSIALRRSNHLNSMHVLHTKGAQGSKANVIQDPYTRSRSHNGIKPRNEPKAQEIPLLSGLFPSLTEYGWGRATPFACCKIQKESKKPRTSRTVSSISHQNMEPAWVMRSATYQPKMDCKCNRETILSNKNFKVSCIKPYNYVPMMSANAEGERMRSKLDSIRAFLGEKRTLPIKEYEIKYSQRHTEPEVLRCNEIAMPKVIHSNPPSSLSCITLNALLVFRPDEEGLINLHLEPSSKKNEASAVKRTEKEGSTSTKTASHSYETKDIKQKSGGKVGMINTVKKQINKSCTAH